MARQCLPLHIYCLLGCLILIASAGVTPAVAQVSWRSGAVELVEASAADCAAQLEAIRAQGESRHVVVRFSATPDTPTQTATAAAGVRLLQPLGRGHYFASIGASLDVDFLARLHTLNAVSTIDTRWKLDPIWERGVPPYAELPMVDDEAWIAAHVVLHADVSPVDARKEIAALGGNWVQPLRSIPGGIVHLPLTALESLAALDSVQWVEPPMPPLSSVNNSTRNATQAGTAQSAPYSLDGSGVSVMVYDGGTAEASHLDFGGRLTARDNSGTSEHATHVSGTIGGDGTASSGQYRGMAPGVTIESYGLQVGPGGGIFLYQNPGDLEGDYDQAINAQGVSIANNSIGTNVALNNFPCGILGDYGVGGSLIDSIVRGSLGPPISIVWAAGNERGQTACGTMYSQIAPPSGAKNPLVVGAVNSNNDSMTDFSGWGPTDDGRLRPDFVAPGCQSNGDSGVTSCGLGSSYVTFCGTSMAAPAATGLAALLIEHFRTLAANNSDPLNSTLKSLLAHNAVDLGNVGPDYQYGYGALRVLDTLLFLDSNNFVEAGVQQGESWEFSVVVLPSDPELRLTLAWDDLPGAPNVSDVLVNDLDLVVTDPNGMRHYPWTLNPANPSAPAVRTTADHTNNLEQVLVSAPVAGTWQVSVDAVSIALGSQRFSLAVTPQLQTVAIEAAVEFPERVLPHESIDLTVSIRGINDVVTVGSCQLHYSVDGGAFVATTLTDLGGGIHFGAIPGAACGSSVEYYFSVSGMQTGLVTLPRSAPNSLFRTDSGMPIVTFEDAFELDQGWTVGTPTDTATTGIWERVDPIGTAAQPGDDHTQVGTFCFVTGQGSPGGTLGENDIDDGSTTLLSPAFDGTGNEAVVSYWRWYSNDAGAQPNSDIFVVDITSDGQNWTTVETVGPTGPETSGGWFYHEFRIADLVTPSQTMQVRFVAADDAPGSLVEAAVDDFKVESFGCSTVDCNNNGISDANDISSGTSEDIDNDLIPDECQCTTPLYIRGDANRDFTLNLSDATMILSYLFISGPAPTPLDAADANDDEAVNLQDPLVLLGYLFGGGVTALPAPFPGVGCGD